MRLSEILTKVIAQEIEIRRAEEILKAASGKTSKALDSRAASIIIERITICRAQRDFADALLAAGLGDESIAMIGEEMLLGMARNREKLIEVYKLCPPERKPVIVLAPAL